MWIRYIFSAFLCSRKFRKDNERSSCLYIALKQGNSFVKSSQIFVCNAKQGKSVGGFRQKESGILVYIAEKTGKTITQIKIDRYV